MARGFDGTDDEVDFGSDASIDSFTARTVAFWLRRDRNGTNEIVAGKNTGGTMWGLFWLGSDNTLRTNIDWTTTNGVWTASGFGALGTGLIHIAVTYDGSATTNDPIMYINGVSSTLTEVTTPVGTLVDDQAQRLNIGEDASGSLDLDGAIQNFAYDNRVWAAEEVRRHMNYGRPGGAIMVLHPLYTSKLANEGTATADGTAAGATVESLPRTTRPGTAMMGMGIGW